MTVSTDLLGALKDGPLNFIQLAEATGHKKKTITNKLWELRHAAKVARSTLGDYSLVEEEPVNSETGQPPETPANPEDRPPEEERPPEETGPVSWDVPGPQSREARAPTDDGPHASQRQPLSGDKGKFKALLMDCGVRRALDTITDTFFAGDTENLAYLVNVLEDSRAYVDPQQKRLIVRYWAHYTDSPPLSPELETRLSRDPEKGKPTAETRFTSEIGWRVEKDKAGDYMPRPGGELATYQEALRWAATMNATKGFEEDEPAEGEEAGEGGKGRRRRGAANSLESLLMKAVIDKAFPGNGGSSAADERVRELEKQLADEREARMSDRFERLEALIAANAGGDQVEALIKQRDQMLALGMIPTPTAISPGDSPTVSILKDSTDKLDKNMNRFVGIMERAMLRGHDNILPEDRSTEAEQEDRAGTLLNRIDQNDRSRQLAKNLWGAR